MPERRDVRAIETIDDSVLAEDQAVRPAAPIAAPSAIGSAGGESSDASDAAVPPPGVIVGHFVVEELLGTGGMGVVVAARDRLLDRKVALKLLRRGVGAGTEQARLRLLREAQVMAKLSHAGVVTVFEVGMYGDQVFIAMELVDGCTLGQWLRQEPRTPREIIDIFARAGSGLVAAHQLGVVHRDFKPENVLIGRDGRVRVSDFGLVGMAVDDDAALGPAHDDADSGAPAFADPLTRTGALVGTPRYMAPEQFRREKVTPQIDQFAFCVALYEALYGTAPFRGSTVRELRERVLAGELAAPAAATDRREVPPRLREIVTRGLAARPDDRWPDMAALLAALTHDPSVVRRRRWRIAIGAVALASAAGIGALFHRSDEPPPCPSPAPRLAGVWDSPTRARIETAFAATGHPSAADTFARTAGTLDRYARAWTTMRTEACEATAVRHEQSPALLDRRIDCLDRRLVELGELTALFRDHSDRVVVDRAAGAALGLVPLTSCADANGLLAQVALPHDPVKRAEATALRAELARATALTQAGKAQEALAQVTPLAPRARALGYAPVLGEVLLEFGLSQRDAGDAKLAEATVIEATRAGAEAKDDALVANAMIEQMSIVGFREGRHAEALALVPYIEAAIVRAGNAPLLLGGMYRNQSILLRSTGKLDAALPIAQRAVALDERAEPDGRELAKSLIELGNVLADRRENAPARAAYERARDIAARLYGPDHAEVVTAQVDLANVLSGTGQAAAAVDTLRAALASTERTYGPESTRSAIILSNMGMMLDGQERWDEGRAVNLRALAVTEKAFGPEHPQLALPLSNLGDEMSEQQRWDEAAAYYGRALAIREKALGKDSLRITYVASSLAHVRMMQKRFADALVLARRVLTIREREFDPGNPEIAEGWLRVGEAQAALSHFDEAMTAANRGISLFTAHRDQLSPTLLGEAWFAVARVARQAGKQARAREAVANAKQSYERAEPSGKRDRLLRTLAEWAAPLRR